MANGDEDAGGGIIDDIQNGLDGIREGANDVANAANNAFSFTSDPLGFLFEKTREAAHGLSADVLPALIHATQPDFSLEWFRDAYAVSFAAAVFLWVTILAWTITQTARGRYTGDDLIESLTTRVGLFIGCATFGPAAGWFVLQFFSSLSEAIAEWGINSSTEESIDALSAMIEDTDPAGVVGGVMVALPLMLLMLIGLVLVIIALIATMVTVYFGGAVAPLAFAWWAHPQHGRIATRLIVILLGVIAAKPLLFFALGVAYRMASGSIRWIEDASPSLEQLTNLAAAVMALCLAGLTPFLLFKFMPVTPTNAGQAGPALHAGAGGKKSNDDNRGSQTQRRAQENAQHQDDRLSRRDADAGHDTGSGGGAGGGAGGGGAGGGGRHGSGRGGGGSGHDKGPIQSALEAKQREHAGTAKAGGSGSGVKVGASVQAKGGQAGTAATQEAVGSGAAAKGAGAGGAAGAGRSAMVGGAAGAAVGVAGSAAAIAAKKTAEAGAKGGDIAAREMDGGSQDNES